MQEKGLKKRKKRKVLLPGTVFAKMDLRACYLPVGKREALFRSKKLMQTSVMNSMALIRNRIAFNPSDNLKASRPKVTKLITSTIKHQFHALNLINPLSIMSNSHPPAQITEMNKPNNIT